MSWSSPVLFERRKTLIWASLMLNICQALDLLNSIGCIIQFQRRREAYWMDWRSAAVSSLLWTCDWAAVLKVQRFLQMETLGVVESI